MHRRDFLLCRTERRVRIAELSCERLYMRYLDSRATVERKADWADPIDGGGSAPWEGEPAAVLETPTTRQLFDDLDRQLRGVDVLRVSDRQWLRYGEFRREVEALVSAFHTRGGRVEYSNAPAPAQRTR